MGNQSHFLSKGKFVQRKYNQLLLASLLSWIVLLIDGCADSFLAGMFINEEAVAAVELVTPFFSVLSFFSYLVAMGTAMLYSRESGAFNYEHAYKIVGQGVILSLFTSVLLTIGLLVFTEPIINFYNPSPQVAEYAIIYMKYQLPQAAVYPLGLLVTELIIIDGDALFAFLGSFATAFLNLGISYVLVGKYEIKGLSIGTFASTTIGFVIYVFHFFRKTNSIKCKFAFNFKDIGEMVKYSSTVSLTYLYIAITDIVMNKFIIYAFTDIYLPAYTVINLMLNIGVIFAGCFDAASGFVCVGVGEKNPFSIKKTMKIAIRSALIESVIIATIMEIFATIIPVTFGITTPEVYNASVLSARAIAISFPFLSLSTIFSSYYPSTGHVLLGNTSAALYMIVTPIGVAMPLGMIFGFNGLIAGFSLTSVSTLLVILIIILCKYGKKAVPLILEKTDEKYFDYEISLNPESIEALVVKVKDDLVAMGIESNIINEIEIVLEESYMTILEKNGNKKILTECNVLVSPKTIRVITRDNGKIFDLTDTDTKISDMRSFVLARYMERNVEKGHCTTVSFNRNSYLWNLHEENA